MNKINFLIAQIETSLKTKNEENKKQAITNEENRKKIKFDEDNNKLFNKIKKFFKSKDNLMIQNNLLSEEEKQIIYNKIDNDEEYKEKLLLLNNMKNNKAIGIAITLSNTTVHDESELNIMAKYVNENQLSGQLLQDINFIQKISNEEKIKKSFNDKEIINNYYNSKKEIEILEFFRNDFIINKVNTLNSYEENNYITIKNKISSLNNKKFITDNNLDSQFEYLDNLCKKLRQNKSDQLAQKLKQQLKPRHAPDQTLKL